MIIQQATLAKLSSKLRVETIEALLRVRKSQLQSEFGAKTGEALYNSARGIDNRPLQLVHKRRTVGTQISWGVRFSELTQVNTFITDMAKEVSKVFGCCKLSNARSAWSL